MTGALTRSQSMSEQDSIAKVRKPFHQSISDLDESACLQEVIALLVVEESTKATWKMGRASGDMPHPSVLSG